MNIVKIPLLDGSSSVRTLKAIEISKWLQNEYGLVRDKDFDWSFMSSSKEVHFRFFNGNEEMASFMFMKWA